MTFKRSLQKMKKGITCIVLYMTVSVGLLSCTGNAGSTNTDVTAPSVPAGLSSTPTSSTSIGLSWHESTDDIGVAGYNIFRNGLRISTSTVNAFSDIGLLSSTTYTYAITAYDSAGNESAQSAALRASTLASASVAVQSQIIASDSGVSPAYPRIAVDANGHFDVVWRQAAGAIEAIATAQFDPVNGWDSVTAVMPNNIGSALTHDIAANTSGDAMAVWQLYDGVCYHIWANKYVAGTDWEGAVPVESSAVLDAIDPAVALDLDGNAMAVWRQTDGSKYKIWTNRFVAGTGWGTAELLDADTGGFDFAPQIAIDPAGNAIAVWLREDGPAYSIRARRYIHGIGWEPAISILSIKSGYSQNPRIAMDDAGNTFVVWNQDDVYPFISTWSCRYVADTGWEMAQVIETDDRGHTYNAQIAVTPGGDAFAAWEQSDGTRYNIVANRYVAGIGWGTAQRISSSNGDGTQWPALAVDTVGNAVVAWEQFSNGTNSHKIYAARYTAGEGWGLERPIRADNNPIAVYPEIAMDKDGYATVVWEQYENTKVNIWAARFR
jgi:chitodextrinase